MTSTIPNEDSPANPTLMEPLDHEKSDEADDAVGPGGIQGWAAIKNLASSLFHLKDKSVLTGAEANNIISLWEKLPEGLKSSKVAYPPRYRPDSTHTGRFKQTKPPSPYTQTVTPGLVSLRRAMVGGDSGPATAVDVSPVVEQLVSQLEKHFVSPIKVDGRSVSRWRRILTSYRNIRELVTMHDLIMKETNIQLFELNQTTLMKWWNDRQRHIECRILTQGLPEPPPRTAPKPDLPPAKRLLPKPQPTPPPPHQFVTITT
ncbi:Hypothetical predicted protein [Paramuricea clavata]|uniref:Uncharacterized protein n=1 Tax=Paramuricea clavata TaxID=317549 RepID=A0A7D9HZG8_PARCT|nr:Hypothetical predicted protein [Paramuricea clavata]